MSEKITRHLRTEVWSDLKAAGGSMLTIFPDEIAAIESEEIGKVGTLRLSVPRSSTSITHVIQQGALRGIFENSTGGETVKEFRINRVTENKLPGAETFNIFAEGPRNDLRRGGLTERIEANGDANLYFELYGLTPTQHLGIALTNAPTYWSAGTVESSKDLDMIYDADNSLRSVEALGQLTALEFRPRLTSTGYKADMLTEIGSTAEVAHILAGKNLASLFREADARRLATRVYPRGGGGQGERATMADNQVILKAKTGNVLTPSTVDGVLIGFDDQFNGFYVENTAGVRHLIGDTDSTAQTITLSSGGAVFSTGQRFRFRRNSSGAQLTFIQVPDSTFDFVPERIDRPHIPPVNNLALNPFTDTFSTAGPSNFVAVGGAVLAQSTDETLRRHGRNSISVTSTTDGDGVRTDSITVAPTANSPFFTAQATLRITSGAIRMRMVVGTSTGGTLNFPPEDAEQLIVRNTQDWIDNLGVAGIDLNEINATTVQIHLLADSTAAVFNLDAVQLTQTAAGVEVFHNGFASNKLIAEAVTHLVAFSEPIVTVNLDTVDLSRLHPTGFPSDFYQLGGTVAVKVPSLALDFTTRVLRIERDWLTRGATRVRLSNSPEDLIGQLGAASRRAPVRRLPITTPLNRPTAQMKQVAATSTGVDLEVTVKSDEAQVAFQFRELANEDDPAVKAFTRVPTTGFRASGFNSTLSIERPGNPKAIKTVEVFAIDQNGAEGVLLTAAVDFFDNANILDFTGVLSTSTGTTALDATLFLEVDTDTDSIRYAFAVGDLASTAPPTFPSVGTVEASTLIVDLPGATSTGTFTIADSVPSGQVIMVRALPYTSTGGVGLGGATDHGPPKSWSSESQLQHRLPTMFMKQIAATSTGVTFKLEADGDRTDGTQAAILHRGLNNEQNPSTSASGFTRVPSTGFRAIPWSTTINITRPVLRKAVVTFEAFTRDSLGNDSEIHTSLIDFFDQANIIDISGSVGNSSAFNQDAVTLLIVDSDTDSVRHASNVGVIGSVTMPTDANVEASTLIKDLPGATSTGKITLSAAVPRGQTIMFKAIPYTSTGGTGVGGVTDHGPAGTWTGAAPSTGGGPVAGPNSVSIIASRPLSFKANVMRLGLTLRYGSAVKSLKFQHSRTRATVTELHPARTWWQNVSTAVDTFEFILGGSTAGDKLPSTPYPFQNDDEEIQIDVFPFDSVLTAASTGDSTGTQGIDHSDYILETLMESQAPGMRATLTAGGIGSSPLMVGGNGLVLNTDSSGSLQAAHDITISTAAASGTPTGGTNSIWFQR